MQSAFSVKSGSCFVRFENSRSFFNSTLNMWYIYTYSDLFPLDISGFCLLLGLRQAVIIGNCLKDFTNNALLISILL